MILRNSTLLGIIVWLLSITSLFGQTLPLVQFTVSSGQGVQGSRVCLDVRVSDFTNVESIQFNLSYNASLIIPECPPDFSNSDIPTGNIDAGNFNCQNLNNGFINFVWTNNPTTLPDNALLFTVCFNLIGNPGNISPIYFNGQLLDVEICQVENNGTSSCTDEIISNTGTIKIISNTLDAFINKCDADANNIPAGGNITFYATGGTPPYNYTITPGGFSGVLTADGQRITIPNIPSGANYTLNVTDSGGSTPVSKTINISDNIPIMLDSSKVKKPTCFNRRNGEIDIFVSGGSAPYQYEWSNLLSGLKKIEGLPPSKYTVTITDVSGCQIQRNFDLEVDTLKFDVAIKDTTSCQNARNGIITISNVSGENPWSGTFNFQYTINNIGNPKPFLNSIDVTQIGSGNIKVTVLDSALCSVDKFIFMPFKKTVSIDTLLQKDITCSGKQDGEIRLRAKPGSGYAYFVSNPPNIFGSTLGGVFILDGLAKGTYTVTTRDAAGCTANALFEIKEPDPIVLNPTVVQPDCVNPGSITLNPTGGTGAYTYTWNPPATGNVNALTGLSGGNYTVSVTDANNCTATPFSVQLNPQGALNITTVIKQPISCIGKNDAVVIVEIGSANGPFNVTWRDATNTIISNMTQVSNLGPGVYTVVVSDNNSCSNSKTVTIDPGSDFTLTTTLSNAPCFDQNGKVEASVSGNSTGFKYEWRVKGQSAIIDNDNTLDAKAGTYTVKAISPAGCEKETDVTITEPAAITFPAPETRNVTCFGLSDGAARILNGPSNINYSWSNGTSGIFTINLPIGNAWVVGSVGSCKSDTVRFNIGTFPKLQLDLNKTQVVDPICFGDKNGSVTVEATGGTGISYTYTWRNGVSGPTLTNIGAGTYILDIGDSNNCIQTDTFILTQPSELVASLDKSKSVELDCNNQTGGKLALMTTGGNPGIKTITWQSGVTTNGNIAIDLNPGTYCATISDNFGCRDTFCYTLVAPAPLVGELNIPEEPKCFGDKTCISVKSISGGTGNKYTFQIITGGTRYPIGDCVDVFAGTYSVILIDSAGCDIRKEITIRQPNPIIVELGDDVEVQLGLPTPTITASVTDNVGNTQLVWTPSEGITCLTTDCLSIEANPTQTTTYLLTVTDQNGCTGTDNITVNVKNLRNVYFANAFSPNNDGFNDHFQAIIGPGVEKILTFAIYDRWGGQVFLQENYVPDPAQTDGWNGTFGNTGRKLDPGVFVYYAKARFIDGKEIEYKGTITLMDKTRN